MFAAKNTSLAALLSPGKHPGGPMVLIAESDFTHCFYAVEQVRPETYFLCKLCTWITLKHLEKLNSGSESQPYFSRIEKVILPGDKWWHKATIQNERALPSKKQCKSWAAGSFQLCLKAPVHQSSLAASPEETVRETLQKKPLALSNDMAQDTSLQGDVQNANEIFDMIRSHYQEALYMSQVRSSPFFGRLSNTDRLRHHWHTMRKDHYLALARSFKV